jgi:FtsH-binding integral membrane protein
MAFGQARDMRPIPGAVATAGVNERATFIRKTYAHLAGAIGAFVLFEYLFVPTAAAQSWIHWATSGYNWFIVLGLFMAGGWIADRWARSATSRGVQYVGLGLYVLLMAFIMAPLLTLAAYYATDQYLIHKAAVITLMVFAGLTGTVVFTKKDFSFLRPAISIGFMVALGVIVASMLFGFALGTLFAAALVLLTAGSILYTTSQVFAHYRPTQYVSAALALFAGVALMFYYVLYFLYSLQRD